MIVEEIDRLSGEPKRRTLSNTYELGKGPNGYDLGIGPHLNEK
jgi:hypothetical protein